MTEEEKKLSGIFPSPEIAAQAVEFICNNKPRGYGRKSNAPYFNERHGTQMKKQIDAMIQMRAEGNPQSMIFSYSIWCNPSYPHSIGKETLYKRINQSINFVIEKLDDVTKKYQNWLDHVRISRDNGREGVCIDWISDFLDGDDSKFQPQFVKPKELAPQWKEEMNIWLENTQDFRPFVREGLALTKDEMVTLNLQLKTLTNIKASIKPNAIHIIKFDI